MHQTHLSNGVLWSTTAISLTGPLLAAAGWEDLGLGVWLGALGVQSVFSINVLLNRRRARSEQ